MTSDQDDSISSFSDEPVQLLYREGPCIVVAKPPGVLTQAPPGIDSMERRVKDYLRTIENKTGRIYLGVPHRLDRPVSGALVFARHVRAARRLAGQFENRSVRKVYWAIVEGNIGNDRGTWTDFLRKIPGQAAAEVVDPSHPEGRQAVLHYRLIATREDYSRLEIELETGRTHQIRVQAAHRGHPVVGDYQYGATLDFGPPTDDRRDRAIGLHARRIDFRHPMSREAVTVRAPPPPYWQAWVAT